MDLLEYYHNTGKCPDWAYYQLNGKTAQENYNAIVARRHAYFQELLNQLRTPWKIFLRALASENRPPAKNEPAGGLYTAFSASAGEMTPGHRATPWRASWGRREPAGHLIHPPPVFRL